MSGSRSAFSRRGFLATLLALAGSVGGGPARLLGAPRERFRLGIITDEVSRDPERAIAFVKDLKLNWVELRNVWGKHVIFLDRYERKELRDLLARYGVLVSNIAAPTYKTTFPGTSPVKKEKGEELRPKLDHEEVLWRAIETAKYFNVPRFRVFTFWRVAEEERVRLLPEIQQVLHRAVKIAERNGLSIVVENEHTTNVASGAEMAEFIRRFDSPYIGVLWDPGNAVVAGDESFREGYTKIPRGRIYHLHLKDVVRDQATGRYRWVQVGSGQVDFVGQFRALYNDRFRGTLSLETHFHEPSRELASLESMKGVFRCIAQA